LPLDLVDLGIFLVVSIVFAEIYTRWKVRRILARAQRAAQALAAGQDTPDALAAGRIAQAALHVALRAILTRDDEGRWHLTKYAKVAGRAGLQAVGEFVKVGPPRGGGSGSGTLDLAGLDLDQLVAVGVGMLPKKQQGVATIAVAVVRGIVWPLIRPFLGKSLGGEKTGSTSIGEIPAHVQHAGKDR